MIEVLFIQIPLEGNRDTIFAGLQSVVSRECYTEALGYGSKEVALRRLLGEALVRFALKRYWQLPSRDYRIARGEKGKPFIVGVENVFFNISHSGDYVVCSVSDREIGIDIEKRAKARMEVAGRFFHEEEMALLKRLEGDKRDQLFFNYWSVKESFLKYIGTGLTRPLNSFVVKFTGENISLYEGVNKLPLRVNACPIDSGYACYVCSEYNDLPHLREITFEEIARMG